MIPFVSLLLDVN